MAPEKAGLARRLQRAAEREASLQDQLTLQFESELEGVLRRAEREIARLARQLTAEDGQLVRTRASLGRALRMRTDIGQAFETAGFRALADRALGGRLDTLAESILSRNAIGAAAADLTPLAAKTIVAFKELRLAELLDWGTSVSTTAWRVTVDGVLGLRHVDDLVLDLGQALDTSLPRARTLYDTAVSTFSREVGLVHATGEDDELFLYAGPIDSITRPFCRARVGKVYARDEIDEMDNGQIPNVLITGGGYNCRHVFKRVSRLDAELQELHETGGRLAHITEKLATLDRRRGGVGRIGNI